MAYDLTAQAVRDTLGRNYNGKSKLEPWIERARVVVDRVVAYAVAKGIPLDDNTARLMAESVAAHYYTQMDPLYASKSFGGRSGSYREQRYDKMAWDLDPTGQLRVYMSEELQPECEILHLCRD